MSSLKKQLPLAAFLLLGFVAASVSVIAYREVRTSTTALFGERLLRLSDQLAQALGPAVLRTQGALEAAARDPWVIQALTDPDAAQLDSAAAVIAGVTPQAQGNLASGAWDLSRDLVVAGVTGDDSEWLLTPPPLVEAATTTPLTAEDDTLVHYGIVAPVRDGRRLVGFLQVRQRLGGGGGGGGALVRAAVGESATLLIGSFEGAWTDLGARTDAPPREVIGAAEPIVYERGGVVRLGLGRMLQGTDLTIVTEIEQAVALATTRTFLGRVGLLAFLAVVLATVAAWVVGRRITTPLTELRSAAEGFATGDYSRRAPERGHLEITEVARTFNQMAAGTEEHMLALQASEQRFRSLVTATAQIVWWTDPDGNISEPLPSWQSYTGLSFEETRGAGWTAALHPDDAATALKTWKEAVQSRSLYEAEYRIRRHDGEYRWFVVRFVPVLDRNGTIQEWVGTGTDITKRREAETRLKGKELELQRAQRLDAVGRLAGGIAHDFNNLLTTILVPSELAARTLPRDHPIRDDIIDIRDAALRAGELTRKLLAFGRQQVMTPTLLDVNEAVDEAVRLLKRVIGEAISLEFVPGAEHPTVLCDQTQFEQIIVNLAVNARDAMPDGGSLTIETSDIRVDRAMADDHSGFEPGEYVVLSVTDTGSGMDRETQAQIFEPFFTTKDHDQGTGLGLSTVYGIVRQSGGHILVYSEPGHGTSFKVFLPVASDGGAVRSPRFEPDEGAEAPPGTETILLAEDEEAIRRIAVRILSELGYTVLAAESGEDAVRVADGHADGIDLLVSDVVMPEMNGIELWDRLRVDRPSLPGLFLSGWASSAVVRHGILDGQVPFLQKPFTALELGTRVREALDSAR